MANAKISFRIFDTGIVTPSNYLNMDNENVNEFLYNINGINVSAALDSNTSIALMFGTTNFHGDWTENNHLTSKKFNFGTDNIEAVENVEVSTSSKTAFIGFYVPPSDHTLTLLDQSNVVSISVSDNFDLNKIYTIKTNSTFDTKYPFRGLTVSLYEEYSSIVDRNIIGILGQTFLGFGSSSVHPSSIYYPTFIPVKAPKNSNSDLKLFNNCIAFPPGREGTSIYVDECDNMYRAMSRMTNKMNIKANELKLFALIMSIYPEDTEQLLPMSTIQSISIY